MAAATSKTSFGPLLRYFDHKQSFRNLTTENGAAFMWFQLLSNNLCSTLYDDNAIHDMNSAFSAYLNEHGTAKSRETLAKDVREYTPDKAIKLYTVNMSMLLNKALASENIDALYALRVYIHDLSKQIQLESKKLEKQIRLYHGRSMSADELARLKSTSVGSLISINGYLSTSRNENVAFSFGYDAVFDITYDPCVLQHVHAADISRMSSKKDEEEVLFDINSVFEVTNIKEDLNPIEKRSIVRVFLNATDKGSDILSKYLLSMEDEREENRESTFGRLLFLMGEYTKALNYCDRSLRKLVVNNTQPRPLDAVPVYNLMAACHLYSSEILDDTDRYLEAAEEIESEHHIIQHVFVFETLRIRGAVFERRNKWNESLDYYLQALGIAKSIKRPNSPTDRARIAAVYNNIAIVHDLTHQYVQAKLHYNYALELYQEIYSTNNTDYHHSIGETYTNLACIYDTEGDYESSRELNNKVLEIYQATMLSSHQNVGKAHLNIGATVFCQGKFHDALKHFSKALTIYQSLPKRPCMSVATALSNSGEARTALGDYSQALELITRGFLLRSIALKNDSESHLDIATSCGALATVYAEIEPSLASAYVHCGLKIVRQSLACSDAFTLQTNFLQVFFLLLGMFVLLLNIFVNGISIVGVCLGFTVILLSSLLPKNSRSEHHDEHPDVATFHILLGKIEQNRGCHRDALEHYRTSYRIFSATLSEDHENVANCLHGIAQSYLYLHDYNKALHFCAHARAIYKRRVPDHPILADILFTMGRVYEHQRNFQKAFECCKSALDHLSTNSNNVNPTVVVSYLNNCGINCYRLHNYSAAFDFWAKARNTYCHPIIEKNERRASTADFYLGAQQLRKRRCSI